MVFACLGSSVLKIPLTSCHGGEKRVKGQSSESFELLFGGTALSNSQTYKKFLQILLDIRQ